MSRALVVALWIAAAGCLSAPGGSAVDGGLPGGGDGGNGDGRCLLFAAAPPLGEVAGTFVDLVEVLAADLDGDGDRDLVLGGVTPLGARVVAARMPQTGGLQFHWSYNTNGPVALAAADLVGGDGCAELVLAETGGSPTRITILGQEVSGDELFRKLSNRDLGIDSTGGLWLAADALLGDGEPAVALATPSALYALPPDGLLEGDAIRTTTIPAFEDIHGIALLPRAERSELLVAEASGQVRWMEPVLPGGQLQFSPLRVLALGIEPWRSAAGADLDRDDERDDALCAGDSAVGLVLDDSGDSPEVTPAPAGLAASCPPFAAAAIGRLAPGADADLVVVDACPGQTIVSALVDARVAAGPSITGTVQPQASIADFDAVALALVDGDGDGSDEIWLFDETGASECRELADTFLMHCD